jgi:hypothetical protein
MQWKIGDVTIRKLTEIEVAGRATWIVPDLTAENLATVSWCRPHFATDAGEVVMSIHALLVESQGRRIIVDTCVGNDKTLRVPNWHQRQGPFLADLAAAGFPAESIDVVLCTHLHVDHVGWNTRLENGRWVPTFPNARYLWHRAEYEHWAASDDGAYGPVVRESVLPVHEAGLVDLVAPTHAGELIPGVPRACGARSPYGLAISQNGQSQTSRRPAARRAGRGSTTRREAVTRGKWGASSGPRGVASARRPGRRAHAGGGATARAVRGVGAAARGARRVRR